MNPNKAKCRSGSAALAVTLCLLLHLSCPFPQPAQAHQQARLGEVVELERELQQVTRRIQANANRVLMPETDAVTRDELLRENEALRRYASGLRARLDRMTGVQAAEPPLPELPPPPELRGAHMSPVMVDAMLDRYARFAELEQREAKASRGPLAGEWENLARDLESFRPLIMEAAEKGRLTREHYGQYALRTLLLTGMAHLYASSAWYNQPPPGRPAAHLDSYHAGLETLEKVIALAHEEIERLDRYDPFGPRARIELAGVHRKDLGLDLQYASSVAARRMLQEYCPWGRNVLMLLDEAGLMSLSAETEHSPDVLDLGILRPYAGDGVFRAASPFWSRFVAELQIPRIWERRLRNDVPQVLRRDMDQIIGEGPTYVGTINRAGVHERIEWADGVRPQEHFTLMVVSPAVFDLTPGTLAKGLLTAVDYSLKSIAEAMLETGLEVFGYVVKELCGEDATTTVVVERLIKGREVMQSARDVLVKGESMGVVRSVAAAAFERVEQEHMRMLFDGIDVQQVSMGKSYHGAPVPGIFVVGDVLGYEQVQPYEYHRLRHIRLVWQLRPQALTGDESYDLTGPALSMPGRQAYLSDDPDTRERATRFAWPRLEGPLGLREQVITPQPRAQVLRVRLPEQQYSQWLRPRPGESGSVELRATLHAPADTKQGYVSEPLLELPLDDREFSFQLFSNRVLSNCPDGTDPADFYRPQLELHSQRPAIRLPSTREHPVFVYSNLAMGVDRRIVTTLTTEYYVRIMRNGQEVDEIFLNFGPRHKNRPMEGRISRFSNGVVMLRYPAQDPMEIVPYPIAVDPNERDLYPSRLTVSATGTGVRLAAGSRWDDPVPVYTVPARHSSVYHVASIYVGLGGLDLEPGFYRGTVRLGERTYTMWGVVRTPGGGAAMRCDVPIPDGRHELTISVPGVPQRRMIFEREGLGEEVLAAVQRRSESFAKAREAHRRDPSPHNTRSLLSAANLLALALAQADRGEQEYEMYRFMLQLNPEHGDSWQFPRRFRDAAFRAGDRAGVLWAGPRIAEDSIAAVRQRFRQGTPLERGDQINLNDAKLIYLDTIRWHIALGGGLNESRQLFARVVELIAMHNYDLKGLRSPLLGEAMEIEFPPEEAQR